VKIRRLPETDLARIAPLPYDKKFPALRQVRDGRPTNSYRPLRSSFPEILNVQSPMFAPVEQTEWAIVERQIQRLARTDKEFASNIGVAKALHQFGKAQRVFARSENFSPLFLSSSGNVNFWLDLLLALQGRAVIPFVDPRRSHGLTAEGRRFVFSMMHEHIRAAEPDFAEAALGVIQFTKGDDDKRNAVLHLDEGIKLFRFDELDEMVRETYQVWIEVCHEGEEDNRRRASGGGTLL
jgi:hypothetical protein